MWVRAGAWRPPMMPERALPLRALEVAGKHHVDGLGLEVLAQRRVHLLRRQRGQRRVDPGRDREGAAQVQVGSQLRGQHVVLRARQAAEVEQPAAALVQLLRAEAVLQRARRSPRATRPPPWPGSAARRWRWPCQLRVGLEVVPGDLAARRRRTGLRSRGCASTAANCRRRPAGSWPSSAPGSRRRRRTAAAAAARAGRRSACRAWQAAASAAVRGQQRLRHAGEGLAGRPVAEAGLQRALQRRRRRCRRPRRTRAKRAP